MTLAEICMSSYVVASLLAATVIWSVLVASKRRVNKAKHASYRLKYSPYRDPNTKPSQLNS
jgi:hypothetical protein